MTTNSGVSRTTVIVLGVGLIALSIVAVAGRAAAQQPPAASDDRTKFILTPPPPATPRINGARIYGQRPGRPFLFTVPASGDRPMTFAAEGLPEGLAIDSSTGQITGMVKEPSEFQVTLRATNDKGTDAKPLKIVIGDKIALTPPLGWNSWNCWAVSIDADKVRQAARAMVDSGLANHGWTYINIDDAWQGARGGEFQRHSAQRKVSRHEGLVRRGARHGPQNWHLFDALDHLLRQLRRRQREQSGGNLDEARTAKQQAGTWPVPVCHP